MLSLKVIGAITFTCLLTGNTYLTGYMLGWLMFIWAICAIPVGITTLVRVLTSGKQIDDHSKERT